jgi:hypothetical protein
MLSNSAFANIGAAVQLENNTNAGLNVSSNSVATNVIAGQLTIRGNGTGLRVDRGGNVTIVGATIETNTTDVNLTFGALVSLTNNTIGMLPITCDSTVLSRGTTVCP